MDCGVHCWGVHTCYTWCIGSYTDKKCVSSGDLYRFIILPLTEIPNCVGLDFKRRVRWKRETETVLRATHTCLACRRSFTLSILSQWSSWNTTVSPISACPRAITSKLVLQTSSFIYPLALCLLRSTCTYCIKNTVWQTSNHTNGGSWHPTEIAHTHGPPLIYFAWCLEFDFWPSNVTKIV